MTGAVQTAPERAVFVGAVAIVTLLGLAGLRAPTEAQIAALALLAAAGLPHGALDPLAAREAGLWRGAAGFAAFNLAYAALAALVVAIWLVAPVAALSGFLLISAWHFAGDWIAGRAPARLLFGVAFLSLPAVFHAEAVAAIYTALSGPEAAVLAQGQSALAPVWIGVAILAAALVWRAGRGGAALEIAAASVSALILPPLVFFALYFALLHSPRHLRAAWRRAPDRKALLRTAALYTGLAAIGAASAFALLARYGAPDTAALRVVFVGLAALTVPHMTLAAIMSARRLPER